jgi:hypothetical protein
VSANEARGSKSEEMADYEIRELREGDETSLLETFNLVWGSMDPSFVPRTLAEWQWEFRKNPAGTRSFVGLNEGRVVSQYAALPVRMVIAGQERSFAQIVDSMVHPAHRAGLKRPGLFVQTALPFFDAYGGVERDWVHFGWPVEENWRIGKTFLGYQMVRAQNVLAREPGAGPSELPAGVEILDAPFDQQARWLYERCCGPWGASALRDAAYMNWRFREHPRRRYEALGVRDAAGILRGWAIWRRMDWVLKDMAVLVDWLVPTDEPQVAELLHRALLARARAERCAVGAAIFPEWTPQFADFQERGWLVHPSEYFLVARNFHPRHDMLWLRDHWWYQLGDTDLV